MSYVQCRLNALDDDSGFNAEPIYGLIFSLERSSSTALRMLLSEGGEGERAKKQRTTFEALNDIE
jgi:hypothetical protein